VQIRVPELSLVVLIGVSGSGKSTLARRLFKPTEILSSDVCRGLVSDDENSQDATGDAFELVRFLARKRLARGLLTVVDATNVRPEDRKPLVAIAREFHCLPVAIVVDVPERVCHERNSTRPDRSFGPHVIRNQRIAMRRDIRGLQREGFRNIYTIESEGQASAATLVREPLWNNLRHEHGPFDIIGDVHGCHGELVELLGKLGYELRGTDEGAGAVVDGGVAGPPHPGPPRGGEGAWSHPDGRRLIFLGDLVDRGPASPPVVRLVMECVKAGTALCVPGNHDMKFVRAIWGKNVQLTHGLAESLEQFRACEQASPGFAARAADFFDDLVSHYVLDGGKLVVAHAGLKESMQGRGSGAVRDFALYGETTGETDEFGLPVRHNWAAEYRGGAMVVYGHTPVPAPEWLNNTICIDTGCVFGGSLTALRYPERGLVSVKAGATYAQSKRPFLPPEELAPRTLQQQHDDLLDIEDVLGKRSVETRLAGRVTVRAENAAAALEVMSRFAADPRWIVYLPPTMSPCETSREPGMLEHPAEAFGYYRTAGVGKIVCEEKHMGSRAVVVICRDEGAGLKRFGVEGVGICYTRTGRPFFEDAAIERELLDRVGRAITEAGLWEELGTDWMCLDCELMPWSAKAQALIRNQYAAVGASATLGMGATVEALKAFVERAEGEGVPPDQLSTGAALLETAKARAGLIERYVAAYRRYCWPVKSVDDLRLAPFHVMATEGRVHTDKDHLWHMGTLARLARTGDPMLVATTHREVNLLSDESQGAAAAWWSELTSRGGEGMVVKPLEFVARGARGTLQPAVKCRGAEYLRIIYGPEYTLPENLDRLRKRGLGAKRGLALREFAMGIEGLERFVRREPLRRVHECVFGVLALESEPVDPRL
jgi:polynucleotide kinase-phosphatase